MQDADYVDNHEDPHLSISERSRKEYIEDAVLEIIK